MSATIRSYSASVRPSSRVRRRRHAATSAADSNSRSPSAEPVSGSTACSGCGISPTTLPAALLTPAMSRAEPLKFRRRRVAQHDLAVGLQLVEHRVGRPVAAGLVLGGDREPSPRSHARGPLRAGVDDLDVDLAADEAQRRVRAAARPAAGPASQSTWKPLQMPSTGPAVAGEALDLLHHRREARERAGAQVVAVGEAAGDDHRVDALQVVVAVPEQHRRRRRARRRAARRARRRSRGTGSTPNFTRSRTAIS